MYRVKIREKGIEKRATFATKGSGEGGGIRRFPTRKAAESYRKAFPSKVFETKIVKSTPKKRTNTRRDNFGFPRIGFDL